MVCVLFVNLKICTFSGGLMIFKRIRNILRKLNDENVQLQEKHLAWNVFLYCYFLRRGFSPGETKENMWCVLCDVSMQCRKTIRHCSLVVSLVHFCILLNSCLQRRKKQLQRKQEAMLFFSEHYFFWHFSVSVLDYLCTS